MLTLAYDLLKSKLHLYGSISIITNMTTKDSKEKQNRAILFDYSGVMMYYFFLIAIIGTGNYVSIG